MTDPTTAGGFLLVLALVVPVAGILLAVAAGGRQVARIALLALPLGLAVALAIAAHLLRAGTPLVYRLGGWAPPLGVALRADWLSALMLVVTAVVLAAVGIAARAEFRTPPEAGEARAPFAFWILLLAIWAGLATVFTSGDLFTLYVALELLTFAAVPLVSLDGRPDTTRAALRYLLFALLGSILYLIGAALLYGAYGTLDMLLLAQRVRPDPATIAAGALMTVGLLAKTALVPLHLWLPPAHAGAPAPASAVLSALVVKGSFFIVVRLWFDVMPGLPGPIAGQLLAGLGAVAIVCGSALALRQERLKLMIAYSTLGQLGYLFLMFSLAADPVSGHLVRGDALAGGMVQAVSHATAKAAMFLAAGAIYAALGHDRLTGLGGVARAAPIALTAFVLGGVALTGVAPSGAGVAKKLLLDAAAHTGQWWWAAVLQAGGFFTAGYVLLVLAHAFAPATEGQATRAAAPRAGQAAALTLALCSLLLGLAAAGPLPQAAPANPLAPGELGATLLLVLGGAALAVTLGRTLPRPWSGGGTLVAGLRRVGASLGGTLERADVALRQWPAACVTLLALVVVFGAAIASNPSAMRARTYGKNGFDSMRRETFGFTVSAPISPRAASVPSWMPKRSAGSGSRPYSPSSSGNGTATWDKEKTSSG